MSLTCLAINFYLEGLIALVLRMKKGEHLYDKLLSSLFNFEPFSFIFFFFFFFAGGILFS